MADTAILDALAAIVGSDYITTNPADLAKVAVDGVTPSFIVRPGDNEQVAATLGWATNQGRAVIPRGAGTALGLGEPPRRADLILSLDRLDQVLEYEPADLTCTVQAGIPLGKLHRVLGQHGQWLPLDPARGAAHTVGGIIATGSSGPQRLGFGTPRDRVIGLRIAQADGMLYRGGAKVVKNVAGYDLPKLLVGSLGTLGVVVEATFKLLPLPRAWTSVAITCPDLATAGRLAGQVLTSALTPVALCILDTGGTQQLLTRIAGVAQTGAEAVVLARFGGIPQAVERQLNELHRLAQPVITGETRFLKETGFLKVTDDAELWAATADLPADMGDDGAVRLKMAVIPTRVAEAMLALQDVARAHNLTVGQVAHAGAGVIYGTLRSSDEARAGQAHLAQAARAARVAITALGGTMVLEEALLAVKTEVGVWGPTRGDFRLMRALKDQFDPQGTLNPGRFVGGI